VVTVLEAEGDVDVALQRLEGRAIYADVLAEARAGFRLRVEKSMTAPARQPCLTGAIFRGWTGERWAETVARSLQREELLRAAEALASVLARATGARREAPGASPTGNHEARTAARRPVGEVPIEEMLERARHWFAVATELPGGANAFATMMQFGNTRLFRSTSGARRYQSIDRVAGSVVPFAIENGRIEYDALSEGGTAGFEFYDRFTDENIRRTAATARELLSAGAAPTGRMAVLLDPSTAGTFAHESFGHGTEADQILRERSYLRPLLGQEVGPESLTLVDNGAYPGAWGNIFFDDEGTVADRTVLVDRGRFVEVLHDRETADHLHRRPTGNARRADFLSRSFVRMTNTYVEPGDWSLEELIRETGEGVLLERCTSGIEDPLGGQMQLKVKRARAVHRGELGGWISSMALSGKVLEFLRAIRGVGRKEYFEMSPGFCGKGHTDILPAGTGGSYLLSEAVVGPA
jgi:TldD protein